jgi:hypothetical protein
MLLPFPLRVREPPVSVPRVTEPDRLELPPLNRFSVSVPLPSREPPWNSPTVRFEAKFVVPVPERVPTVTVPEEAVNPRTPEFATVPKATSASENVAVPAEATVKLLLPEETAEFTVRLPPPSTLYPPVNPVRVLPVSKVREPPVDNRPVPLRVPVKVPEFAVSPP